MTADERDEAAEVEALAAVLPDLLHAADDLLDDCTADDTFRAVAAAILASDWFARRLAEARAEGAQAVLAAVVEESPCIDLECRCMSSDVIRAARAAAEQAQP